MIGGSYVPFYVGRKLYLLAYVSIAEWETYELLKDKDMAAYLVYCSMHRANTLITMSHVKRLIRWHRQHVIYMIKTICSISLPPKSKDKKEKEPTSREIVSQVKTMFRLFSKRYNWTPSQISQMSPLQLYEYMAGGEEGTGVVKMSPAEYAAYYQAKNKGAQDG